MPLLKAKTKYGVVTGVPGDAPWTSVFKGVPFAKPPVGPLRFHEPVEPDCWEGELACDTYPNSPVMEPSPVYSGLPESEDCLYMNISTPAETPGEKLPVMVWIYGGGFNFGTICTPVSKTTHRSESARYEGEAINKRGVILVTPNYRVSFMGFAATREVLSRDGHAGNYGLLDLVAALKWVHENIAAFGGDPDNVTIFGQSAGAVSCRMLLTSPLVRGKGYVKRAIIQSGCGLNDPEPYRSSEWICDMTEKTLASLGYTTADCLTMDALTLAHSAPMRAYQLHTGLFAPRYPKKPAIFTPCLDGYSLTRVPGVALYAGDYDQDVDIMIGTVRQDELQPIKHCFEAVKPNEAVMRAVSYSPGVAMGRRFAEAGRKPVYTYFFERNIPGIDPFSGKCGPYHGGEIAYEFGTLDYLQHDWTDYDYRLSEAMTDYWTNFAKTGDPNENGLPEWQAFTKKTPVSMNFLDEDEGFYTRNLVDNEIAERVIQYTANYPGVIEELKDYVL